MIRCVLILLGLGGPALAEKAAPSDAIASVGPLADEDFFRLASCGAPPGGKCLGPIVRWPQPVVTLSLVKGHDPVPDAFREELSQAIDHALRAINDTGAGVTLRRVEGQGADIRVTPVARREGETMRDIPGFSAKGVMGVGYMSVWWNKDDEITAASVLISTSILPVDLTSVMLEEVTQTLGPIYDIDNPWYEGVSILSQNSNATKVLKGQDAALLKWLYPPEN